jgi:hypothetical protein
MTRGYTTSWTDCPAMQPRGSAELSRLGDDSIEAPVTRPTISAEMSASRTPRREPRAAGADFLVERRGFEPMAIADSRPRIAGFRQ